MVEEKITCIMVVFFSNSHQNFQSIDCVSSCMCFLLCGLPYFKSIDCVSSCMYNNFFVTPILSVL